MESGQHGSSSSVSNGLVLLAGIRWSPDSTALVVRCGSPVAACWIWSRPEVINHRMKDGEIDDDDDDDDCFKVALASRHSGYPLPS